MGDILKGLALLFAGALASIIGGILLTAATSRIWLYASITGVVILIFYGSGMISKAWHMYNLKRRKGNWLLSAKVGILADIDLGREEWENAWSDIKPEEWKKEIESHTRQNLKVKVKLINIKKNLDSYIAVLNPYAGAYTENDPKNSESLSKIFDYVGGGGIFVNVSDIPGYWQYNPKVKRMLDATPPLYGLSPMGLNAIRQFELTPFMNRMGLKPYNVEGSPVHDWKVEFAEGFSGLSKEEMRLKVQRAIVVEKNVKPVIKPANVEGLGALTPLCLVYYGEGTFIISLPGLNSKRNPENAGLKKLIVQLINESIINAKK